VEIGEPAVAPLVQVLNDKQSYARENAARLLGEMHDTRATPYLVRTLKDEDEQVRKNAAQSLGTIGDRRATAFS